MSERFRFQVNESILIYIKPSEGVIDITKSGNRVTIKTEEVAHFLEKMGEAIELLIPERAKHLSSEAKKYTELYKQHKEDFKGNLDTKKSK
ncbi:unnamed protein product [marine sediment metagenome]|uniref:Uncharacterized protein n=1 Tax=marine sediment metagenome TaxID=412755 RepID=X0W0P2_9ZZZZ